MDLKFEGSALSLISAMANPKCATIPKIPFVPQKPEFRPSKIVCPFERCSPEDVGISSKYLSDFLNELRCNQGVDMHNIMIIRKGHVIVESGFGPYDPSVWHITHSECKTITGIAIGLLVSEGKLNLDDRIVDIFDQIAGPYAKLSKANLTVKHLLTMTSGITFNEAGSVTETDWVRCYLESAPKFDAGTKFDYNSMNTYMLAAIVKEITGQGLSEYLDPRLFEPLGITNYYWEKCPKGIEKAGWGLYILPEDIAKIGYMLLCDGVFNSRRILPENWVKESTTFKVETPPSLGSFDYGYQVWTGRKQKSFLMNGMFGQDVLVYPDTEIMIVINAGNNELFQQSNLYDIMDKYFGNNYHPGDNCMPKNTAASTALTQTLHEMKKADPKSPFPEPDILKKDIALELLGKKRIDDEYRRFLNGKKYVFKDKDALSVSLLPLYIQAIQNNFTKGLESMKFDNDDGIFTLRLIENDTVFNIPLGFDSPIKTTFSFHGEKYLCACQAKFYSDEWDRPALRVRVSFLETSSQRIIRIIFCENSVIVHFDEQPGEGLLHISIDNVLKTAEQLPALKLLFSNYEPDYLLYRIHRVLSPELTGYPE